MFINKNMVKESLEREAQKKIRKGENLSNLIYSSVGAEVVYSKLEDNLPTAVYIQLVEAVNEWLREKLAMFTA